VTDKLTLNDLENAAIEKMPREFALAVGLRTLSPLAGWVPNHSVEVPAIDTGAAFRPDWRMQDPAKDPSEPFGSEGSSAGNDHGWSNCTMVSAALVYAYHVKDKTGPQGGNMRHNQDDLSGGTDLYDAKTAWSRYGNQTLTIKSGAGWNAVKAAHDEGRAILIQGEGNVPGSESFDGSHACAIGIETNSEGKWLWGDPLASGWQWAKPGEIKAWAERLHTSILFAVSKIVEDAPAPAPVEPDEECPPYPVPDYAYAEASAVAAYQSELLRESWYWVQHPTMPMPFPIVHLAAMEPNGQWNVAKWNETTWHLDESAGRWGTAVWAGTADISGGAWA
jgi:hypothetical protein